MFITIAFTGSTTEPKARKSSTNVATAVSSAIHGRVDAEAGQLVDELGGRAADEDAGVRRGREGADAR